MGHFGPFQSKYRHSRLPSRLTRRRFAPHPAPFRPSVCQRLADAGHKRPVVNAVGRDLHVLQNPSHRRATVW